MTFYLLVPAIGAVLGRFARRRGRVWAALGAAAVLGLCAQAGAAAWTGVDPHSGAGTLGTSILGHAAWFAVGGGLAVVAETDPSKLLGPVRRWLTFACANPGVVVLTAGVLYLLAATPLAGPVDLQAPTVAQAVCKELLYAVIATLLVLAATSPVRGTVAMAAAGSPAARWLGDASYPVFLWHVLILQVLYLVTSRSLFTGGFTATLAAVTALSVVVARMSVGLLERPVLVWAHRRTRDAAPAGTP